MIGKILCKLGIHKWSRPKFIMNASSHVKDYSKYCLRCGKKKTWTELRNKD